MADEKCLFTSNETIVGLLEAVRYYASGRTDDEDWDGNGIELRPGARARAALAKYGSITEVLSPTGLTVDIGDVHIKGTSALKNCPFMGAISITIDDVPQSGVQRFVLEADVTTRPMLTITRYPLLKNA